MYYRLQVLLIAGLLLGFGPVIVVAGVFGWIDTEFWHIPVDLGMTGFSRSVVRGVDR